MIFKKNSQPARLQAGKSVKAVLCGKKNQLAVFLLMSCAFMHGQSDLIPPELQTTAETIKDYIQGDIAVVLLTIFFICSAIAYGFHKESQKAKIAFIAVCIACFAVALAPTIVEKFASMGTR